MLQAFRDRVMGVLGWVIIGLIIVTFALFGLGSYLQDQSRPYAAKVNDVEITPSELQMAYLNQRERMQQMLGDAFNPGLIEERQLKQQALDSLINRQLILQAAEKGGMAVSDQLLAARIHAIAAFQKAGKFDADLYREVLARQGQTPARFEQDMRLMFTGEQLTNGLSDTVFVTDAELRRIFSLQQQKRSFSYLRIPAEPLKAEIEPDESAIKDYYAAHAKQFTTPQRVRLSYVRLNADVLGKDIDVGEQAIQEEYEQRKAALKTKEQRRASHILFPLASDADTAEVEKVRAQAEDVLKKIRGGADFGKLAKEFSGDPGSASQGGDLGYFPAGTMVPAFDKTVFAMHKGDVSDPVRTQFGFHIIKLTDIKKSEIPPLEKVRDEMIKEIRQQKVGDLYYDQLEQLSNLVFENPGNLQAAADALGLEIKTTDWITAANGPGIGQYPEVRVAAFSEDVLESGNNSEPVEVGQDDAIAVRIKDREPAHPTPLDEVKGKIVAQLKQEGAAGKARELGEKLLHALDKGKTLDALAQDEKLKVEKVDAAGRDAPGHDRELLRTVFSLPRPDQEKTTVDKGVALANGDYVLIRLSQVEDADPDTMSDAQRTQLKRGLENMRRNLVLSSLLDELRSHAEVVIPKDSDAP